ncbi:MAG TPA: hypothetical protein PLH37_00205 [bacterium]|nr:hypothetical protein [bacterium]
MDTQQIARQTQFPYLQENWRRDFGARHDYVFLVYPGRDTDRQYFCSDEDWQRFLTQDRLVLVAGRITPGITGASGLLLATGVSAETFIRRQPELLPEILRQVNDWASDVEAHSIGLAGIMPSIIQKRSIPVGSLFVKGLMGSTWLIIREVESLVSPPARIAIVGFGYLGGFVSSELERQGFIVVKIDKRKTTEDIQNLKSCELVIALTPAGDDMCEYYEVLRDSQCTQILFDCHPVPSRSVVDSFTQLGIRVFQTTARAGGVVTMPPLPNFEAADIPGCLLDAIVRSQCSNNGDMTFQDFGHFASNVGIQTPAIELV